MKSTQDLSRNSRNSISDVDVTCGSLRMELQILMCPFYFSGYNETLMSLNAEHAKDECKGTPDWTVDPPVLKFNFSITEGAIATCSNKLKVTQEVGTGVFAQFSNIQFVNISGMVISQNPYPGTISYRQELIYKFSCCYPLQYLVNTTHMDVSAVSLAVKEKNGSFISTLGLLLYSDNSYTSMLRIPDGGLELKTRIFVEVRATNLTNRFNVFLDRCYATTTPFPVNSFYHDLFIGCDRDGQTVIGVNGQQQEARFSFEAFRFVQEENRTLSTFYLHCATRLCERSFCSSLSQVSTRFQASKQTFSSGPIITRRDNGEKLNGLHMLTSQHSGTLQQLPHQNIEGTVTHSLHNTYFTSVVVG
uniref:Si:ch73-261i21.5 n=1 Tax=Myripristis murdjan TaxID=586833 RepID=A0A667Z6H1_9TELE